MTTRIVRHTVEAIGSALPQGAGQRGIVRHTVEAIGSALPPDAPRTRVVRSAVEVVGSSAARSTSLMFTPAAQLESHTVALAIALAPGSFLALHSGNGNVYEGLQIRPVQDGMAIVVYSAPGYHVVSDPLPLYAAPLYLIWMLDVDTGTARLRINGVERLLLQTGDPAGMTYAQIGGFGAPHEQPPLGAVDAHISDLIVYDGVVSAQELRILEIYLGVKIAQTAPDWSDSVIKNFVLLRPHIINPGNLIATSVADDGIPAWPDNSSSLPGDLRVAKLGDLTRYEVAAGHEQHRCTVPGFYSITGTPRAPLPASEMQFPAARFYHYANNGGDLPAWPETTGDGRGYYAALGSQTVWQTGIWECVSAGWYDAQSTPALPSNQNMQPEAGLSATPVAEFVRVRSVNSWSCLNVDGEYRTRSGSGIISYTLAFAAKFTGVALVHMTGVETATILVSSDTGSKTISKTYPAVDTTPWYVNDLLMHELEGVADQGGMVEITLTGNADLSVGAVVVGYANVYGRYIVSPIDRNVVPPELRPTIDAWGRTTYASQFISRGTAFKIQLDRWEIDNLERTLQEASTRPMVYAVASVDIPIVRYASLKRANIPERNVIPVASIEIASLL